MATLKDVKRIVIKVGTSTLAYPNGKANIRKINKLVTVISDIVNSGLEVALVTSGAIGVGVGKLGLSERPTDTAGKQAAATVGQCELMFMYDKMFGEYGHVVGQFLLTKRDVENDECRHNIINAFEKNFEFGAIPIINENDSIAIDEIVYGDNDNLSAIVAKLIQADALIILTDIDGLYDSNPKTNEFARIIPVVEEISGLGLVPSDMITVSTSSTNSEPSTSTGFLRPDSSGSPSSMRIHFIPVTFPSSSSIISTGFVRRSKIIPSSLA